MKSKILILISLSILFFSSCKQQPQKQVFLGADLSYVNEMDDCDGIYNQDGKAIDAYELFSLKGANIVRVRLWHTPDWSGYSNFNDVQKTISRAKKNKMAVLLDFHYSDTWADPQHQVIPKAWENISNQEILGDSLYNYTFATLQKLQLENLLPEMVQIGNETNIEIMQPEDAMVVDSINWERNVYLLNRGITAVNDFNKQHGTKIQKLIHIAQPENAFWWFEKAIKNGLIDFEWIGLSYYPKWSVYRFQDIPQAMDSLIQLFGKRVMIVETAYTYTLEDADSAGNILGKDALIPGYPATPEGQRDYLTDLVKLTLQGGGEGVIYWEPAWISTRCSTPWGQGSHWDNATFFDAQNNNEALPAFEFFNRKNYQ